MPKELKIYINDPPFTTVTIGQRPNKNWIVTIYNTPPILCRYISEETLIDKHYSALGDGHSEMGELALVHSHYSFSGNPKRLEKLLNSFFDCETRKSMPNQNAHMIATEFKKFNASNASSSTIIISNLKEYPNAKGFFPSIPKHHSCIEQSKLPCAWSNATQSWQSLGAPNQYNIFLSTLAVPIIGAAALLYRFGFLNCFKKAKKTTSNLEPTLENSECLPSDFCR